MYPNDPYCTVYSVNYRVYRIHHKTYNKYMNIFWILSLYHLIFELINKNKIIQDVNFC